MKSISAFRGYRGFYEIRHDKCIEVYIYRDGYKYECLLQFTVKEEIAVLYRFRHEIYGILKNKTDILYPDLVDQTRPTETKLNTDNSDANKLSDIPKQKATGKRKLARQMHSKETQLCEHTFDNGTTISIVTSNIRMSPYEVVGKSPTYSTLCSIPCKTEADAVERFNSLVRQGTI